MTSLDASRCRPGVLPVCRSVSLLAAFLFTVLAGSAGAQEPTFVKDLRPGAASDSSNPYPADFSFSDPAERGDPDGHFFFWADEGLHGRELWRTDGVDGSQQLVTDICPGPCSSALSDFQGVRRTSFPGRPLLVKADDGATGAQVWRVSDQDGSARRLTSLCLDPDHPCEPRIYFSDAVLDDGRHLFAVQASDPASRGAWATDGTPEGTVRLWTDQEIGDYTFLYFYRAGDRIVFPAYSPERGTEWYRAEGDGSLPELIEEVCPGACPTTTGRAKQLGDRVVFFWLDTDSQWQTWVTDGSAEGTESLHPACGDDCSTGAFALDVIGERGFFFTPTHLWTTDGTVVGTRQVAPLPQEVRNAADGVAIGSSVAFALFDFGGLGTLWRLDRPAGPNPTFVELGDVARNSAELASTGDRILVTGWNETSPALWTSDGTPAGTFEVPVVWGAPAYPRASGNRFYVMATDESAGRELWVSDGTQAGTHPLHDLRGDPASSDPGGFQSVGDRAVFFAPGEFTFGLGLPLDYGRELWATDGSEAGTERLLGPESVDGVSGLGFTQLTSLGDRAIFQLETLEAGAEPWITDGTGDGTLALGDLQPGSESSFVRGETRLGDRIVFAAEQGSGQKLWSSDGTATGTRILVDIDPDWYNDFYGCGVCSPPSPPGPIFPRGLTRLGDRIVFGAVTAENGAEPWITDGTADGTRLLADLVPGPGWSEPTNFTRVGDLVYFLANDGENNVDVWRTDGTAPGTRRVTSLDGITWLWSLHEEDPRFQMVGFDDGSHRLAVAYDAFRQQRRLWIVEPEPGPPYEHPVSAAVEGMVVVGSWLYFTSDRVPGEDGRVLWTLGYPQGATRPSTTIYGPVDGGVRRLAAHRNGVYFAASDDEAGHELWHIGSGPDGMPLGLPQRVADLRTGTAGAGPLPASSSPDHLAVVEVGGSEKLFFSADDGVHGKELWTLDLGQVSACRADATTACLNDRFRIRAFQRTDPSQPERPARTAQFGDGGFSDTAFFTFFGPGNLELAVKVIDGTPINDAHWLFYGALSDVEYRVVAEDLQTGIVRTFQNPAGEFCGQADVGAFPAPSLLPDRSSTAEPTSVAAGKTTSKTTACIDDPATLCLHDRFEVNVSWRVARNGTVEEGVGTPVSFSDDSGVFWFFGPGNAELVVKLLDGRPINDRWWFFYGALSDVEYDILVTDRVTGAKKTYHNDPGNLCGSADVDAFND